MPYASTTLATESRLPLTAPVRDAAARLRRRRRQRMQMLAMVAASYAVDVLLMLAFAAAGAIGWDIPLGYGASATLACGAFWVAYAGGWTERFRDHYLVVANVSLNVALILGWVMLAPEVGMLLIMVLFIVMSFGALRMAMRQVAVAVFVLSLVIGVVMALGGDRLEIPMATPAQRLLSGLWFGLVLARTAALGLYGSRLREALVERNAQLAAAFRQLELSATHDDLTGALNRRRMMELLREEHRRMKRTGSSFAAALLDLDHFKRVNDDFGHHVGDQVLQRFSSLLTAHQRGTDRFARHGGEEFLLLLPDTGDVATASDVVDRLRTITSRCNWTDLAPGLAVTVSAGVAVCDRDESLERLLQRADAALYEAKAAGRDRVRARAR